MATEYHVLNEANNTEMPKKKIVARQHYGIVVADWNNNITYKLLDGAIETLLANGATKDNIHIAHVPGTFELTYGSKVMADRIKADAVIAIGCVVRGDTPHFDYICQGVTQGLTSLNASGQCPFIFNVLTTETMQQAEDRAGGKLGNKGSEAAIAAIVMANIKA